MYVAIACFRAWKDERNAKKTTFQIVIENEKVISGQKKLIADKEQIILELRQELLEEKQTNTPQLEAIIDEMAVAEFTGKGIKHSAVTLKICVSNLGMPSVAVYYARR